MSNLPLAFDAPLIGACIFTQVKRLLLIPLDHALPTLQARLAERTAETLESAEYAAVAELLAGFVKTAEVLIAFALRVGGRPCPQ